MSASQAFLEFAVDASLSMVTVAIVLGFYRIVRGPSLADRVVSLDMMTISVMVFCGLCAVMYSSPAFVDVAIVIGLVGFIATVALARFAERQTLRESAESSSGDRSPAEVGR